VIDRRIPAWAASAATAVVLVGFVIVSFVQRWNVLSSSPFPLGVDGYFYPVQLRSLLDTGTLQYAASPMTFWLMAPLAAATDPITGAKLGAALYGALIAFPAYGVAVQLAGRDARGHGLVASALVTFSAGSAYMSIEFVKNGIGITVALAALWLVLRALETPSRARVVGAIAGLVAAMLAHKMAAGIVLGIAVPAAIAEALARGELRGRRLLQLAVVAAIAVIAISVAGMIAPRRFLSPADARLIGGLFTVDADWTLPVLASSRSTLRLGYEPLVGLILGGLAAAALVVEHVVVRADRPRRSVIVTSWFVVGLALVIGLPWLAVDDSQGLGMRLRIVAFVPMALCATIVLRVVSRLVLARLLHRTVVHAVVAGVLLVGILALRGTRSRTEGRVLAHPAIVSGIHALAGRIPDGDTVIVPERHIAFMVAWYTRAPISIRPEPVPIERRWRVMPLAFIGMGSPLDDALIRVRTRPELPPVIGLHPRHPNGLVLVPEVTWQYVLTRLPSGVRDHFAAWPAI
jgi:hypothetical protein